MHILLAEDNLVNQKIALSVLTKAGHRVAVAQNGQEAADLAQSTHFNAILLDLGMPVMDGIGAARLIRRHGVAAPIIALTANALTELSEECRAAGFDDYLCKPFSGSALLAMLAAFQGGAAAGTVPQAPFAANALLDLNSALRQTDGDAEAVKIMASMVVAQIEDDLPNLRRLSDDRNSVGLCDAAHRLRGSLASMGAIAAHGACLELEAMAKKGDADEFAGGLARLEAALARVIPELINLANQPSQ